MKKQRKRKKGLAMLLTSAMVVGLVPGGGTLQVSATESDENTVNTVSSNEVMTPEQTDGQATDKLITDWQWIDEEEYLDEETGSLSLPGANEQTPAYFDDVTFPVSKTDGFFYSGFRIFRIICIYYRCLNLGWKK